MGIKGHGTRTITLTIAVGLIGLVGPSSAGAATQIGEVFNPSGGSCVGPFTDVQSISPQGGYAIPFDGVITSWSFQASATAPQQKLKIFRAAGGNDFTVVGESALEAPAANTTSTFPTRISVKAGDLLGRRVATNGECVRSAGGYTTRVYSGPGDIPPGTTGAFPSAAASVQIDLAAMLEPDADADGFGDETQDQCPTDATTQGACPPPPAEGDTSPPQTTITGLPKKRRGGHSYVSFESSEPGSTFRCALDHAALEPCSSPKDYRRLKSGIHTFTVVAIDPSGNADPTPASEDWKVKKKKKK